MKSKQIRKTGKVFLVGIISLMMVMMSLPSSFAAVNSAGANVGTEDNPAEASITKHLEMGEKTTAPDADFTFVFEQTTTPKTITKVGDKPAFDEPVNIVTSSVPISAKTVNVNGKTGTTTGGKKVIELETGNFLEGLTFPSAGVYEYTVTEEADTYNIDDETKEKMTYSQAEYKVYVYVANKASGTGTYVKGVGVVLTKNDAGTASGGNVGTKVDPTPNPNNDGSVDADNSDMMFKNTYLKTEGGGGDPTNPENQALQIGKTVTGDLGDHQKYFNFEVEIKKPSVDTTTTPYKGYIVNSSNTVVTADENVVDSNLIKTDVSGKKYIEFAFVGGASLKTVMLKHGQKLVFTDASVGAHFNATETPAANYTPSLDLKLNGASITGSVGQTSSSTGEQILAEGTNGKNLAAFINAYKDITPTGIIMNNLSFIMLIAVAGGLIAGTLVIRNKKRKIMA